MQLLPKFMSLLMRRNSVSSLIQSLCFHSTPVSLGKWKNKWNDSGRGQHQSKDGGIIGDDDRNGSRNFEPDHNQPQSGRS